MGFLRQTGPRLGTMDDVPLDGKRVFVRVDFNVSVGPDGMVDQYEDYRIRAALPTIEELVQRRCKIVLCTHLGRPHEGPGNFDLAPVHRRLEGLLHEAVRRVEKLYGPEVMAVIDSLEPGSAVLLPNVRLDEREEAASERLADELAVVADAYVNEAFSVSHRNHASVALLPRRLPACAGRRTVEEYAVLSRLAAGPERPYVAIVSGAKVRTKLTLLRKLLEQVDTLCIGGVLANMFLANQGKAPRGSFAYEDMQAAQQLWDEAHERMVLPTDVVIGSLDGSEYTREVVALSDALSSAVGVWDVGPETVQQYLAACQGARTVMWNGPVGMFEVPAYAGGTRALAEGLARLPAFKVAGGGETVQAVERYGVRKLFEHVSVGGGALVALLEGSPMPGLDPLWHA